MDVVIGIASMFGIEMDENFKRPYFLISITDFKYQAGYYTWNMDEKIYLFYPLSLSKGMGKFESLQKTFGKTYGRPYQSVWQISWYSL